MMGHTGRDSSPHNTAHDSEFVEGSSNLNLPKKSKKRKHSDLVDRQLNDFESEFHEHFKTFTPAQNEKDANIESRYCVKFQLNVLFYPDGKDSRRGIKTEKRNGYER